MPPRPADLPSGNVAPADETSRVIGSSEDRVLAPTHPREPEAAPRLARTLQDIAMAEGTVRKKGQPDMANARTRIRNFGEIRRALGVTHVSAAETSEASRPDDVGAEGRQILSKIAGDAHRYLPWNVQAKTQLVLTNMYAAQDKL